ncbi:hypothetical protein OAJ35_02785 [Gammaproteobacteria bacterium]|nr:hypothetical protein [Gammaproteobacteria bacterium]
MSLFDEIIKKNSKKHGVDQELVKKIIAEQQKEDGNDASSKQNRQNKIENIVKDHLK